MTKIGNVKFTRNYFRHDKKNSSVTLTAKDNRMQCVLKFIRLNSEQRHRLIQNFQSVPEISWIVACQKSKLKVLPEEVL